MALPQYQPRRLSIFREFQTAVRLKKM